MEEGAKQTQPSPRSSQGDCVSWDGVKPNDQNTVETPWPRYLPRPPSLKRIKAEDEMQDDTIPMCVVYNANSPEGSALVRALSERGNRVVAVVRVYVSKYTKEFLRLERVVVKVASGNDQDGLFKAAQGCQRAYLVTRYWERFDSANEEDTAFNILDAITRAGVKNFVMACFEDTAKLTNGRKSELQPDSTGLIFPQFEGMKVIDDRAKAMGTSICHMMTSYVHGVGARKSVTLLRGPSGKLIVKPYYKDPLTETK